ncbi:FecR family protein [Flavobacterium glycines]|uniref:Anti-sigma factor n=1 Tax=Flavobacterium glycines TaxID=551990 RepID=A0A1B9DZ55_9FLAO|nr:FecR family protein [Flavobacterium glycines]OCB74982.1 anti-sigma factor [Flavobacterium glycines]GEL11269.1 anti-sigma factor [Flavobacterium glycines]SDJ44086.1 FecR family protein [Flavobacterium glycines]
MKKEKEILKWLNGELSAEEIEDLKQSEDFETIEKIAHYSAHLATPKVDAREALASLKSRNLTKKEPKVRTLNFRTFFKVAAAVAVVLTSAYFLFFNSTQSFETGIAQTKSFQLPDNSEVLLNASSKITFNEKNWDKKRDLTLEGEAYFQVQKGKTFSVKTADGVVKVLGTHFDVKQRDNYYEVSCFEGLVSVTYNNTTVKLPPGKSFRVINKQIEKTDDFDAQTPSWLQKESSFTRVPLNQVIAELERQYDIQIETQGIDTSKLFTGGFTHTNQKTALESITIPLQLSYTIKGKTVTLYQYEVQ